MFVGDLLLLLLLLLLISHETRLPQQVLIV
jgi:hypothetical protein